MAIHKFILDGAIQKLSNGQPFEQNAANDMTNNRAMATLGSIGPDLFFWSPDYEITRTLYRFYQNYQELMKIYNRVMEPIREIKEKVDEAVVEPIEDAAEEVVEATIPHAAELIGTLLTELKETAELFKKTIYTDLFAGVFVGVNGISSLADIPKFSTVLFDSFKPPLQDNKTEKDWYWFDMLHYRQTGLFAQKLLGNSITPEQKAYSFGYMSHIASDLLGHGFVNEIVNGPFRMHVQRHVVVENFMDARKFFELRQRSINQQLFAELGLPDSLPKDVGDLLFKTFNDTYKNFLHPQRLPNNGFLSRKQIDETYDIFIKIFQQMEESFVNRPEEPFSGAADILSDAFDDLVEPPPAPPSSPSAACSLGDIFSFGITADSRDCYEEFFEEVKKWAEYLEELVKWALETLMDLIDLLLTLFLMLPIGIMLGLLFGIQLMLYNIYQSLRSILVLEGFLYPEPDDLNSSHGRNLTTIFQCIVSPFKYPKMRDLKSSPLGCPADRLESPTTVADFHGLNTTSDAFITNLVFNLDNLKQYSRSPSPANTRELEGAGLSIGNATDMTKWMISTANNPNNDAQTRELKSVAFTNWNLDSDRGYGYKDWKGKVPHLPQQDAQEDGYV